MRYRAAVVPALCLVILLLSACSGGELPAAPTAEPTTLPTAQPTRTAAPVSTPRERPSSTPRPASTARPSATRGKSVVPFATSTRSSDAQPTEAVAPNTETPFEAFPTESAPTREPTRSIRRPTATTFSGFESPTPELSDFDFIDQNDYVDSLGNAVVVGLIKYTGSTTIGNIQIAVDLEDADHKLLATQSADIVPDLVQPDGFIPFSASFSNPPSDYEYYNTTIEGDDADQSTIDQYTTDFAVTDDNLVQGSDPSSPTLTGKITNTGNVTAQDPYVIVALLDDTGHVLDVNSSYTTLSSIDPGDQGSFEVDFENGEGATDYQVVVSASTGP